jgi:DNA-binding HxlR family transcriptional regulator
MTSTHKKVPIDSRPGSRCTPDQAATALRVLDGRWKLLILFHLFDGGTLRFAELQRRIPAVTHKMLIQQLKALEQDGVVRRVALRVVPPHVEYSLTAHGEGLRPALEALATWAAGYGQGLPGNAASPEGITA